MNDRVLILHYLLNYNVQFYAFVGNCFRYIKLLNNFNKNNFYHFIELSPKFLEFLCFLFSLKLKFLLTISDFILFIS